MIKIVLSVYFMFINCLQSQTDPNPDRFFLSDDGDQVFIKDFLDWDKKNTFEKNGILFIGSSSIRKWKTAEYFNYKSSIINRGFGGSHISDINYYFNTIVLKYKPKIIVFYAGDNDIAGKKAPEQVLDDYVEFVGLVRKNIKQARIIYIPIKPSPSRWSLWGDMAETNKLIKMFIDSDDQQIYLDTATPMLNNRGKPSGHLFVSDSLHLSEEGYVLWSEILKPALDSLIYLDRFKIFPW